MRSKLFMRFVGAIAIFFFISSAASQCVIAADLGGQNNQIQTGILKELMEKRQENAYFYLNKDGSETAVVYNTKVNYKTGTTYEKIDNSLVQVTDNNMSQYKLKNSANDFNIYIKDKISDINPVEIDYDKYKVDISPVGIEDNVSSSNLVTQKMGTGNGITLKGRTGDLTESISNYVPDSNDTVEYNNAYGAGSKLQYQVLNTGVKESIILNSYNKKNIYEFTMNMTELKPEKEENGIIVLKDKTTGEIKGGLPAPFMYDSAEEEHYSENIQVNLDTVDESKGIYRITYFLDQDFLTSNTTIYPITIDPSYTIEGANSTYDSYVESAYPGSNYRLSEQLRAGNWSSTGKVRSYIKFPLPNLNGATVTAAVFAAYGLNENVARGNNATIEIHKANGDWTSSGITWNNKPSYGDTIFSAQVSCPDWYCWNVSSAVKDWYNGSSNYGFVMKDANETWQYRRFSSSDGIAPPALIIHYINPAAAPTANPSGNELNSQAGSVALSWPSVNGAKGYFVGIFNGKDYDKIDVGNVTSWNSKGKGLWPTASEINGPYHRYQIHTDGKGQDLPDDPVNCYKASGGTYGNSHCYYFRIIPYDDYGVANIWNCGCTSVYIPDRSRPEAVKNVKAQITNLDTNTASNNWTVKVNWDEPIDIPKGNSSGLKEYKVVLREISGDSRTVFASQIIPAGTKEAIFNNVQDCKEYEAAVWTYDKNGNGTDDATVPVSSSFITADKTPPSTPTHLEIDECVKPSDHPYISWYGITDNQGISSVQYRFDTSNQWVSTNSDKEQWSCPVDCSALAEGKHYIYVRGIDKSSNSGPEASVQFTVDSTPPAISFSNIYDKESLNGLVYINGTVNDPNLGHWMLYYAYGKSPSYGEYKEFADGSSIIQNGLLGVLNLDNYMTGCCCVKLTAYDKANNKVEKIIKIQNNDRDNVIPELLISKPKGTLTKINNKVTYSNVNGTSLTGYKMNLYVNSKLYQSSTDGKLTIDALDFPEGSDNNMYLEAEDNQGNKITSGYTYFKKNIFNLRDITWEKLDNVSVSSNITLLSMNPRSGYAESKEIQYSEAIQALKIQCNYFEPLGTNIYWDISTDGGVTWKDVPVNETFILQQPTNKIKFKVTLLLQDEFEDYNKNVQLREPGDYSELFPTVMNVQLHIDTSCTNETLFNDDFTKYYENVSSNINKFDTVDILNDVELKKSPAPNNDVYYYSRGTIETNTFELVETVRQIKLEANYDIPTNTGLDFYISSDNGNSWQKIAANTLVNLDKPSSSIKVKAELYTGDKFCTPKLFSWKLIEVSSDNIINKGTNFFGVQLLDIPKNLTATPMVNYDTLLRWDYNDSYILSGTRFNIYRSTDRYFTPSDSTLMATVNTKYWNDYNLNYGETFYYKVAAVKDYRECSNRSSIPSNEVMARCPDQGEMQKRLGIEDYWSVSQFRTGSGQGYINENCGNLTYQSTDFSFPSPILAMVLRRSYNSLSTCKSSFGYGWDFNFNTNLLCEYDSTGKNVLSILLKDGDGTVHKFVKKQDGTYESPKGSNMNLVEKQGEGYEIQRNDNITYEFNSLMRLVKFEEPNGNTLNITYNGRGNIDSVYDNYNHYIKFNYNEPSDKDLISSVIDPANREYSYKYENGRIKQMSILNKETNELYTEIYNYYADGKLQAITNPKGNPTSFIYYDNNTLKKVTEPEGQSMTIEYSPVIQGVKYTSGTTKITNNNGSCVSFEYNENGNVTKVTDPLGNSKSMIYDDDYNIINLNYHNIINGQDTLISNDYHYDKNGNIETASVNSFTCDSNGNLQPSKDNGKNVIMFEGYNKYNEYHSKTTPISDDKYAVTTNEYDDKGNLISTTDAENRTTTYNYDSKGFRTKEIDCYGNETEYQYYQSGAYLGFLWKKIQYVQKGTEATACDTNGKPINKITEYVSYDAQGNPTEIKDPNGISTKYKYDTLGRKTEVDYIDNSKEIYSYDLNSNLLTSLNRKGEKTSYQYDKLDRQTIITPQNGKSTSVSYEYDHDNNTLVTTQDGGGRIKKQYYDKGGRLIKEANENTHTRYEYDNSGNMTKIIGLEDEKQNTEKVIATAEYNIYNQMIKQSIDPDGKNMESSYEYDLLGEKLFEKDGEGNVTSYQYDKIGRLLSVTNKVISRTLEPQSKKISEKEENDVTQYQYDQRDGDYIYNVTIDALGRKSYTYLDAIGRTVKEVKGEGNSRRETSYEYDLNDNQIYETKPDGTVIENDYNNLNQLKQTWYGSDKKEYTTYDYDLNGKVATMIDKRDGIDAVETDYHYDDMDRIKQTVQDGQPTNYYYDGSGNLTDCIYTCGSENRTVHYEFDKSNRLMYITANGKLVTSYNYNYAGKVSYVNNYRKFDTETRNIGQVISDPKDFTQIKYTYNSAGMATAVSYLENGTVEKERYDLQYDQNGRIKSEKSISDYTNADYSKTDYENKDSNKEIKITKQDAYGYDSLGRLISDKSTKQETGKTDEIRNTDYTYDLVGNRLGKTNEKETLVYEYNDFNNLLKITKDGKTKSEYKYDDNGNQTKETTQREKDEEPGKDAATITKNFQYDKSDRLTKSEVSDGKNAQWEKNYYNGSGQRIEQKVANGKADAPEPTDNYVDTRYYYNSGKLLYTTDQNHNLIENNILDLNGQVIFSKRYDGVYANQYFMYNYDVRNSVTNIVNPDGKLVQGYSYGEFGDTTERGDKTFKNSIKFTGAVNDNSTGLYYMNSRFYNPSISRFLTQDTFTGNAYEPWTQHLYTYCGNNPINYVDPSGHMATHPVIVNDGDRSMVRPDPVNEIPWYTKAGAAAGAGIVVATGYIALAGSVYFVGEVGAPLCAKARSAIGYLFNKASDFMLTKYTQIQTSLLSKGAANPNVNANISKFTEYIFKDGAAPGKDVVFKNLGYGIDDSENLINIYKDQAAVKYANGEFTLGKLDSFGQRINIEIELPGIGDAAGKTSYIKSGWMINSDGSISLNTPFAGFTK